MKQQFKDHCTQNVVTEFEYKNDVYAINSDAKGLFYLYDDVKESIGIMTVKKGLAEAIVLKKAQIKSLIDELQDVYNMVFN